MKIMLKYIRFTVLQAMLEVEKVNTNHCEFIWTFQKFALFIYGKNLHKMLYNRHYRRYDCLTQCYANTQNEENAI